MSNTRAARLKYRMLARQPLELSILYAKKNVANALKDQDRCSRELQEMTLRKLRECEKYTKRAHDQKKALDQLYRGG